ncbi:MAG: hypothetical protein ACNS61_05095 [Candidatus Wenzhouxiangella sp. M2_3B_020]
MRRLILHVPDLERLRGGADRLPGRFRKLMTRARRVDSPPPDYWPRLIGCPPLPAPAALSAIACGNRPDEMVGRRFLRFDPVRLVPDLTAVWIERPLQIDLRDASLRALREELDRLFAAEKLRWEPCGRFGLVELDGSTGCEFTSPDEARGSRLDVALPRGDDAWRWHRLINESQMVFHQFRSLARGDQHGAGLWLWGEGTVPETRDDAADLTAVVGGSATMLGFARWLDARRSTAMAFEEIADVPDALVHAPIDESAPDESLRRLEQRWVRPALDAMARGQLREIVLAGGAGTWRFRGLDRLALWRRDAAGFSESGESG